MFGHVTCLANFKLADYKYTYNSNCIIYDDKRLLPLVVNQTVKISNGSFCCELGLSPPKSTYIRVDLHLGGLRRIPTQKSPSRTQAKQNFARRICADTRGLKQKPSTWRNKDVHQHPPTSPPFFSKFRPTQARF